MKQEAAGRARVAEAGSAGVARVRPETAGSGPVGPVPGGVDRAGKGRAESPGAGRPAGHGEGRRVVVVEDEPSIAEVVRFLLRRDGWSVQVLDSGHDAARRIIADPPDLAILDVMLPGPSGLDVLQVLRLNPATAQLPVLLLSARGQTLARDLGVAGRGGGRVAAEAAPAAGATLLMSKPFANADLLAAVRQLVGV
jgi:CheY-like chemotaxis protein